MRPLLASLALLLLALCGLSSAGILVESTNTKSSKTSIKINEKLQKSMPGKVTPEKQAAIHSKMSEILTLVMALVYISKPEEREGSPKAALDNGILCLMRDADLGKTLTAMAGAREPEEEPAAKEKFGIDCGQTSTAADWVCFCTHKYTLLFCVGVQYKEKFAAGATMGTCRDAALTNLKNAGTKTIGKYFDYENLEKTNSEVLSAVVKHGDDSIEAITNNLDKEMTNFFCDATDPEVANKLEALMQSDVVHTVIDVIVGAIIFGEDGMAEIGEGCKAHSDWSKEEKSFGECICPEKRGVLFCFYKAIGEFFKKEGFLTCEGEKKFVPEKKPKASALPQILPKGGKKSATTAFSLLAPLAAAATMLLRH